MNRVTFNKRPFDYAIMAVLCVVLAAGLTGCGLRGGQNNQPPAAPTNAPVQPTQAQVQPQPTEAVQPTEAPAQPTAVPPTAAPAATEAPTEAVQQPDTQGDELEQLLDQLDQQNRNADPLDDVPQ